MITDIESTNGKNVFIKQSCFPDKSEHFVLKYFGTKSIK